MVILVELDVKTPLAGEFVPAKTCIWALESCWERNTRSESPSVVVAWLRLGLNTSPMLEAG